ncbi:MAG: hypothetical protein GY927_01745 [bacterium]|nr:hypothetical protein [bacterium]
MTVGSLKKLVAWKNTQPGATPSLHVIGKITAPTPCHDAIGVHTGDMKTNPPVYQLLISLHAQPGNCIKVLSDVDFHYVEHNYAGIHEEIEVLTDSDKQRVKVTTVS